MPHKVVTPSSLRVPYVLLLVIERVYGINMGVHVFSMCLYPLLYKNKCYVWYSMIYFSILEYSYCKGVILYLCREVLPREHLSTERIV